MTRGAGSVLYKARSAVTLPLSTAFFHCSTGGNTGPDEADVFEGDCPTLWQAAVANSKTKMQILRGENVISTPENKFRFLSSLRDSDFCLALPSTPRSHPNSRRSGANRGPRARLRAGLDYAALSGLRLGHCTSSGTPGCLSPHIPRARFRQSAAMWNSATWTLDSGNRHCHTQRSDTSTLF